MALRIRRAPVAPTPLRRPRPARVCALVRRSAATWRCSAASSTSLGGRTSTSLRRLVGMPALARRASECDAAVGISFYTFQSMSYAIDVYRGDARAIADFIDSACFVSLFPQLVAGPIIRYRRRSADQLAPARTPWRSSRAASRSSRSACREGAACEPVRLIVDLAFEPARSAAEAWDGADRLRVQIYFDFSGYSDMAIGLGRCGPRVRQSSTRPTGRSRFSPTRRDGTLVSIRGERAHARPARGPRRVPA